MNRKACRARSGGLPRLLEVRAARRLGREGLDEVEEVSIERTRAVEILDVVLAPQEKDLSSWSDATPEPVGARWLQTERTRAELNAPERLVPLMATIDRRRVLSVWRWR